MRRGIATLLLLAAIGASVPAVAEKAPEGIWLGYDGEWLHVTKQLLALAQATPEDKFAWRPAAGTRSTSEVYMHIALANFWLLGITGVKVPPVDPSLEKSVKTKAQVIEYLRILVHDDEHMGQLIAYARMTGIVPPWSKE